MKELQAENMSTQLKLAVFSSFLERNMRKLLYVPLGIYELLLILIAFLCTFNKKLHLIGLALYRHAQKLPKQEWYEGND